MPSLFLGIEFNASSSRRFEREDGTLKYSKNRDYPYTNTMWRILTSSLDKNKSQHASMHMYNASSTIEAAEKRWAGNRDR